MSRFSTPTVDVEAAELGSVTLRGLKFSERITLFDQKEDSALFAARLLSMAASVDGESLTVDEWDSYGGLHQDDYVALVQAASEQSGLNREAAEKN